MLFGTFESAEKDYLSPPEETCPYCEDCGAFADDVSLIKYHEDLICMDCYRERIAEEGDEDEEDTFD